MSTSSSPQRLLNNETLRENAPSIRESSWRSSGDTALVALTESCKNRLEEPLCSSVEQGVQRYYGDLVRRARSLTRNSDEAQDLAQSTVERALRFKQSYRAETHARAWLMRVMYNLFISKSRRHQLERKVLECVRLDPNGWNARYVAAPEIRLFRPIARAMETLPEKLAETVELVDLFDFSYKEAAVEQCVPVGTVMSRLHRGRARLAGALVPHPSN